MQEGPAPSTPDKAAQLRRRSTGRSSKHFRFKTPQHRATNAFDLPTMRRTGMFDHIFAAYDLTFIPPPPPPLKRRKTGAVSDFFVTDRVDKRRPAGSSSVPVPSINDQYFGIVQEKLWQEPFWLLIAVTFLNKTSGRVAMPVFWRIKKRWPTPELLADADQDELREMIHKLGLQQQRSKRVIKIAKAWASDPPVAGKRYRVLHYPTKGDGKHLKPNAIIEEDETSCRGTLEIAHIPGLGPYAYDSWRMFCRDVLRGTAKDFDGKDPGSEDFEPEWKRVLPDDKELRACLRWMWLREGVVWDPKTGDKHRASEKEMEDAIRGEMCFPDDVEHRFAAQAAGNEITSPEKAVRGSIEESSDEEITDEEEEESNEEITDEEITDEEDEESDEEDEESDEEDEESDEEVTDDEQEATSKPSKPIQPIQPAKARTVPPQLDSSTVITAREAAELLSTDLAKATKPPEKRCQQRRHIPNRLAKVVPSAENLEDGSQILEMQSKGKTKRARRKAVESETAWRTTLRPTSARRFSLVDDEDFENVRGSSRSATPPF